MRNDRNEANGGVPDVFLNGYKTCLPVWTDHRSILSNTLLHIIINCSFLFYNQNHPGANRISQNFSLKFQFPYGDSSIS